MPKRKPPNPIDAREISRWKECVVGPGEVAQCDGVVT
jgi:hypothetical protein